MKKKFKIVEQKSPKIETEKELPYQIYDNKYIKSKSKDYDYLLSDGYLLIISAKAFNKIKQHIQWGNNNTSINRTEQGGLLIGSIFFDKKKKIKYGIVKDIVFSNPTHSTAGSLAMGHNTWKNMLDEFHNKYANDDDIRIIGWYHTHPNNLDVFMSGIDQNTQQRFFKEDWHFAVVLNPHRKIWKVFQGKNSSQIRGLVVDLENNSENQNDNNLISENNTSVNENEVFYRNNITNQNSKCTLPEKYIYVEEDYNDDYNYIKEYSNIIIIFLLFISILLILYDILHRKAQYQNKTITKNINTDTNKLQPYLNNEYNKLLFYPSIFPSYYPIPKNNQKDSTKDNKHVDIIIIDPNDDAPYLEEN